MQSRIKIALLFTVITSLLLLLSYAAIYYFSIPQIIKDIRSQLAITFTLCVLIAFGSGYFLAKKLVAPIKNIADEVKDISAQNLAKRIPSGNAGEWNYLTETLNDLLNRLQESFEVQRRFISVASHELSTPLTSISSQLEVSLLKNRNAADYQSVMQSVHQDVKQLSALTQTLLEFAAVSGNAGGIELDLIRIDEVLLRLPGEMVKLNKNYAVKLEFEKLPEDETRLLVFGNAALLFTAIKNIVSNACKYADDRLAEVKLSVTQKDIIIAVADRGKGIAEAELQHIFQPFYRIEDTGPVSGFGLGLPLVNRIIKLHNGQINISSVVAQGTVFSIQLPCAAKYSS